MTEVADLCRLVAERDPSLAAMTAAGERLTVIACHPRAVRWMLSAAGITLNADRLQVLDLRTLEAQTILDRIPVPVAPTSGTVPANHAGGGPAWFPVIDYSRCRQCRQCLSFCLFGVYSLDPDGKVTVTHPQSCKPNCPACARICPDVAIMFPKLPDAESPLNGDEIGDEQALKARARIKASEVLGDDIYAALAKRRGQARARLLKPDRAKADAERAACSATTDSPPEG